MALNTINQCYINTSNTSNNRAKKAKKLQVRNNCYTEKGTYILNPRVTNMNEGHYNLGQSLYSFSSYIYRCFLMYVNYSVLCNK